MKKQKMLFIYPDTSVTISFSPAIQILSAVLKKQSIEVDVIHLHATHGFPFSAEHILNRINSFSPDVIGFTALSNQYDYCNNLAGYLKEKGTKGLIILGGIHAIISPHDLYDSNFDAFCIGEGEVPLANLFLNLKQDKNILDVSGFWFKVNGEIKKNPIEEYIQDLDTLPFRDYEIINTRKLLKLRNKWLSTSFSRGCVYSCSFCINQKLHEVYQKANLNNNYFRCNSVKRIIDELIYLSKTYNGDIDVFNFDDDLLMTDTKRFIQFMEDYELKIFKEYNIKFAINGRANLINETIVKKLKNSGCELIRVGFETGDQDLRNLVLQKKITDHQLYNAFSLFRKYNLRSLAFAMIGIPGESKRSIELSIKMLSTLKPDLIRMAIFEPFINTPIYEYCKENNLLTIGLNQKGRYDVFSKINNEISDCQLQQYYIMFPWYMNIALNEKYEDMYRKLIEDFKAKYDFSDGTILGDIRSAVLERDREADRELTRKGISHYCYYKNNPMYFGYVDSMVLDKS